MGVDHPACLNLHVRHGFPVPGLSLAYCIAPHSLELGGVIFRHEQGFPLLHSLHKPLSLSVRALLGRPDGMATGYLVIDVRNLTLRPFRIPSLKVVQNRRRHLSHRLYFVSQSAKPRIVLLLLPPDSITGAQVVLQLLKLFLLVRQCRFQVVYRQLWRRSLVLGFLCCFRCSLYILLFICHCDAPVGRGHKKRAARAYTDDSPGPLYVVLHYHKPDNHVNSPTALSTRTFRVSTVTGRRQREHVNRTTPIIASAS